MYKQQHFHFVGINGIGMSAIAKILHQQGHIISGCDLAQDTKNIQELIDAGCAFSNHHNSLLCQDQSINTVVYSSDVTKNNPELLHAKNRGIAVIQRAALLAEIMKSKFSIGVAGSHGKTTTSSMIGHILYQANLDPTIIVGGIMQNLQNNAYFGKGKFLVAETDESDKSHLLLPTSLAVLTSVDFEHANVYKNLEEVQSSFIEFINKLPFYGKSIICIDDNNIKTIISKLSTKSITYGTDNQADIKAHNIQLYPDYSTFDIFDSRYQKNLGSITIQMPSLYNVLNATAAITTALELDIPFTTIAQALATFQGVDRRFTFKKIMPDSCAEIFDDYGHHPTEIYNSLITARRKTKNKLIVVFQPQRYTRTYHLWKEFIQVFQQADIDHLIITDIYSANEPIIENITSKKLVTEIQSQRNDEKVHYVPFDNELIKIKDTIHSLVEKNDLILLLGAGKINKLADLL